MDDAAGRISGKRLEVQSLRVHTLAGEGSVAVNEHWDGDRWVTVNIAALANCLPGAGTPLDDGIHLFKVTRVWRKGHGDGTSRTRNERAFRTQVVLHVPGGVRRDHIVIVHFEADFHVALELGQNLLFRLADNIRDDVQTATVCHSDHNLGRTRAGAAVDHLVQHRDEGVDSLD